MSGPAAMSSICQATRRASTRDETEPASGKLGTAIIIVAVALATSAKVKPHVGAEHEPELPACEAGAD